VAQLAFVLVTLGLLALVGWLRGSHWRRGVELGPAYALGTLGTFWLVERMISLIG
jgi:hypothetical protein